ncbi:MAG: 4-hydroxythreonine-4-phosphate dehydrogenase PdxA [Pseudomonadota bacterium]
MGLTHDTDLNAKLDGGGSALLGLTMGDPAGIGPELTLRAWQYFKNEDAIKFVAFSDPQLLTQCAQALDLEVPIRAIPSVEEARSLFGSVLPVFPLSLLKPAVPGTPDSIHAPAIIHSIETAVAAAMKGAVDAVVTNPISKSVLYEIGFAHPGHTEFLAALAKRERPNAKIHPVMMLACEELRVVPLTIHIPLTDVPTAVTRETIVETVHVMVDALQETFGIKKPRVVVAGLNPHAGEDGTIGLEDQTMIGPAIEQLVSEGLDIRGPLPADTMFHEAARKTYDAALCMYHDQALIPIKTLAFDRGVNVTIGLPFIRTSPDHGTAFDIAGSGTASPTSLIAAMEMADQMVARRHSSGTVV